MARMINVILRNASATTDMTQFCPRTAGDRMTQSKMSTVQNMQDSSISTFITFCPNTSWGSIMGERRMLIVTMGTTTGPAMSATPTMAQIAVNTLALATWITSKAFKCFAENPNQFEQLKFWKWEPHLTRATFTWEVSIKLARAVRQKGDLFFIFYQHATTAQRMGSE